MKCLHCGYCCVMLDVIIVRPEYVDIIDFQNPQHEMFVHKPNMEECPHLIWNDNSASCAIHDKEWYDQTPCYRHTQIEDKDSPCRTGKYMNDGYGSFREFLHKKRAIK